MMSWGTAAGVVLLTTLAGGCAAFGLANFLIYWQQVPNREGAAGYLAVTVTGLGLAGGFLVGLATVAFARTSFLRAEGYALGAVLGLTLLAGVLSVVLGNRGGDDSSGQALEFELRPPAGWKPDNLARSENGRLCWVQPRSQDGDETWGRLDLGDGALAGGVRLKKGHKDRFLRVHVGRKADLTMALPPLSAQWSDWAVVQGYSCRVRTVPEAQYDRDHPSPIEAFRAARAKALAAIRPDASLAEWLPFFEDERGGPSSSMPDPHPEYEVVKAKAAELGPLLASKDPETVRRAVLAAAALDPVPPSLAGPLSQAGPKVMDAIREARAHALPDDPDVVGEDRAYMFFFYWDTGMEKAGAQDRRKWLEEIEGELREVRGTGGLKLIAERVRRGL